MDDKFNGQKDILIAIKKEISLLRQQVDYLIRNEKPLELLDLDVMMNRTHTIYDMMCGVEIGGETLEENNDDEELPVGLDEIKGLFGIEEKEEELDKPEELDEREGLEPEQDTEGLEEENEDAYFIEEVEDMTEEAPAEDSIEEPVREEADASERRDLDNPTLAQRSVGTEQASDASAAWRLEEAKPSASERRDNDTQSFFLNFEPVEEPTEEPVEEPAEEPAEKPEEPIKEEQNTSVYTTGDEIEMTIPHRDIPEEETPEEPALADPEEEIAYEPVVIGDIKEKEDGGFELETPETLGERLQQQHDPTVADRLQHSALNSLQSAIGINDKFLFVNELFNGSMEKYNRSIVNLDDLKTLNGALIYLNELRIELQWNSSNEAYKKLLELVHRKFGA